MKNDIGFSRVSIHKRILLVRAFELLDHPFSKQQKNTLTNLSLGYVLPLVRHPRVPAGRHVR